MFKSKTAKFNNCNAVVDNKSDTVYFIFRSDK